MRIQTTPRWLNTLAQYPVTIAGITLALVVGIALVGTASARLELPEHAPLIETDPAELPREWVWTPETVVFDDMFRTNDKSSN